MRPAHDVYHTAAAFTYSRICSEKKLAHAWRVDRATANRYRTGDTTGALTRLLYEIVLCERNGIDTIEIVRLARRVRARERRLFQRVSAKRLAA